MSRDELVENLGTIARSGTAAFLESCQATKKDMTLIGQFGVGFYSAFMVAEGRGRLAQGRRDRGWRWASDGKGEFTVDEPPKRTAAARTITLHLKDERREFLDA